MHLRASRTLIVEPALPPALVPLRNIARNLYWTWSADAADLFERIDRELWHSTSHNPVRLLQLVSSETWDSLAGDEGFRLHLQRVDDALTTYLQRPPQVVVPGAGPKNPIAYFSLEFALTESLPNYSGGLGVLAGDHLKAASDLGLPLVGVGLLYHEGYFHQHLGPDGWQYEEYNRIDEAGQPIDPVAGPDGSQLRVQIPLDGRTIEAQAWRIAVGKTPLYVLDTNLESNTAADREITARLYGGDNEMRIKQEIVLGIGGVRMLHELGLEPAVCHMNEGHSALLGMERIRTLMEHEGVSFAEARIPVTAATTFTTHTAVAAGIDLFPPELVRRYLGDYSANMGLSDSQFIGLGRTNPNDDAEPFSMALLGLRVSGYRNGVSKLHRGVSQKLWESAWPNLPLDQVPIDSVTNGVHLPTWVSDSIGDLYDRYLGPNWRDDPVNTDWSRVSSIPNQELWQAHERQRDQLVVRARQQHAEAMMKRGLSVVHAASGQVLESNILTIGFARRFAGYKRSTLMFRDPERLAAILNHPERPVQFIFAGKAHPRDEPAKALIREVLALSNRPEFRDRLILLEGYDLELARALVHGCDIWLNTPLRPLEASGTSGMKACANGAIHMSVLDGWWWEAYKPGLGWAVGRDSLDDDPEAQDAFDANSIYDLLENEVTSAFYERDTEGVPTQWVELMKASISAFAPVFNTSRMVAEYAGTAYSPAAASWNLLREDSLGRAREQSAWHELVNPNWGSVKVLHVADDADSSLAEGREFRVTVTIHPGKLASSDIRVDAVHGEATPAGELTTRGVVRLSFQEQHEDGACTYSGVLRPEHGGRAGYAIRLMPTHPDLHNLFATGLAHWA